MRASTLFRLCSFAPAISIAGVLALHRRGAAAADAAAAARRKRPVTDCGLRHQLGGRAFGDHLAAELAGAGTEVDHVVRRGGSCPRRARPRPACCPWPRASRACRAGCGCRAGAGRWSARRGCSTRRAGWSRAARRAGCAAPRRRRASAPSGRARGSRGPTSLEEAEARCELGDDVARDLALRARRARASSKKLLELRRSAARSARRSTALAEAHRERFAVEALPVALPGRRRRTSQPLDPRVEHVSSAPVRARSSYHSTSSSSSPVP